MTLLSLAHTRLIFFFFFFFLRMMHFELKQTQLLELIWKNLGCRSPCEEDGARLVVKLSKATGRELRVVSSCCTPVCEPKS
ncbi:hypothetical protein F5Y09DRAFT_161394 [Xylaria sp. FL1042]|nr:hypothetical protein F5Y09DRAFT_161394 [Xylaria sp. FL1042]